MCGSWILSPRQSEFLCRYLITSTKNSSMVALGGDGGITAFAKKPNPHDYNTLIPLCSTNYCVTQRKCFLSLFSVLLHISCFDPYCWGFRPSVSSLHLLDCFSSKIVGFPNSSLLTPPHAPSPAKMGVCNFLCLATCFHKIFTRQSRQSFHHLLWPPETRILLFESHIHFLLGLRGLVSTLSPFLKPKIPSLISHLYYL